MVIFIILSIKAAFFFCFHRDHNFESTMQPYVMEPKTSSAVFRSFLGNFHVLSCATEQRLGRLGGEQRFSYREQPLFELLLWLSVVFSASSEPRCV